MGSKLSGPSLTAEEYGYALGGPVRATEVAIAALLSRGVLRVSRDGALSAAGQAHGLTRLEAEVVAAVGADVVPVQRVLNQLDGTPATRALDDALRRRGLGGGPRRWWRRSVPPVPRSVFQDRMTAANLLPAAMTVSAAGLVAVGGFEAYPDAELALALATARASLATAHPAASTSACGYGAPGAPPDGGYTPYLGCGSGSSCGGSGGGSAGGSSCGGSGCGGGCGGS